MKIPFLITMGWALAAAMGSAMAPAPARAADVGRTDMVRVVFGEPQNPKQEAIRNELLDRAIMEQVRMLIAPLRLPRMMTLEVRGCDGSENAFYADDVATLCYEYVELIKKHSPKVGTVGGVGPADVMAANVMDTVLHEVGHAVFDMLNIPVLGREEDAADFFSAYILLQFPVDDSRRLVLGVGYMLASEAREDLRRPSKPSSFAGAHGLPAQRYYNLLCMAYGSNPEAFAKALSAGHLPQDRADDCDDEWTLLDRSFTKLIIPHFDEPRWRQAIADVRFNWRPLVTATESLDPVPLAE